MINSVMNFLLRTLIFIIPFLMLASTGTSQNIPLWLGYKPTNLTTNNTQDSGIVGDLGPRKCPEGMEGRYAHSTTVALWICQCQSGKLFSGLTQTCYDAYTSGPCIEGWWFTISPGSEIARCTPRPKGGFIRGPHYCPPGQRKDAQGLCRSGIEDD